MVGGSAVPTAVQGMTRTEIVLNIDLAPTFEEIAGARIPDNRDGASLLPLISADRFIPWRGLAYIEHVKPSSAVQDNPDQESSTNRVPTYWAVRSEDALFVESRLPVGSVDGQTLWESGYEYYTGLSKSGGYEATNVYRPGNPRMEEMRQAQEAYRECSGNGCALAESTP